MPTRSPAVVEMDDVRLMAPLPTPRTFAKAIRQIENWHEVISIRLGLGRRELSLLSFRSGISMVVRRRSQDWDVVRDLFLQSGYARSFEYLRSVSGDATVIDLGGNIGSFSLLAAAQNDRLRVTAYEPGPPNIRMFELNCLANPHLAGRVQLHPDAAAGIARVARWHFDELNAGGSSLYGPGGGSPVQVRSFADIVEGVAGAIALVKIDIEGAEYELVRTTPPESWHRIPALSLEVHRDPDGKQSKKDLVKHLSELGFSCEPDGRFALFFQRKT
jgi:FkbM family methyltransferase